MNCVNEQRFGPQHLLVRSLEAWQQAHNNRLIVMGVMLMIVKRYVANPEGRHRIKMCLFTKLVVLL